MVVLVVILIIDGVKDGGVRHQKYNYIMHLVARCSRYRKSWDVGIWQNHLVVSHCLLFLDGGYGYDGIVDGGYGYDGDH